MSDETSTSSTVRTAARCSRASTRISACRPCPRRRPCPRGVGRDPLVFRRGHAIRAWRHVRPGEGAPVDVLRAVHARAGDRGRPFPRRVLRRRGQPRGDDPERTIAGNRALAAMEDHLDGNSFFVGESVTWPTSRSTRTRTSHTKAASTSRPSRRYGRGSTASPPSPGTFPSTRERPSQICTEPDGIAASRERPHGRREPAIRGRASRPHSSSASTTPTLRAPSRAARRRSSRICTGSGSRGTKAPIRQSERTSVYEAAADTAEGSGAATRDPDGSLRLGGVTLLRPDGSATYQLATVADDLDLGITQIIRGFGPSTQRGGAAAHRRGDRWRAAGGDAPRAPTGVGRQEALQASRSRVGVGPPRRRDPGGRGSQVPGGARPPRARRAARPSSHRAARDRGDRCNARRRAHRSSRRGRFARSCAPRRADACGGPRDRQTISVPAGLASARGCADTRSVRGAPRRGRGVRGRTGRTRDRA